MTFPFPAEQNAAFRCYKFRLCAIESIAYKMYRFHTAHAIEMMALKSSRYAYRSLSSNGLFGSLIFPLPCVILYVSDITYQTFKIKEGAPYVARTRKNKLSQPAHADRLS